MRYKNGVFTGVKPSSENGALQLVARIDSGYGNYSDIQLGDGDGEAIALGINWFANVHVRLAMSYVHGEVDNLDGREFRLRGQFVF